MLGMPVMLVMLVMGTYGVVDGTIHDFPLILFILPIFSIPFHDCHHAMPCHAMSLSRINLSSPWMGPCWSSCSSCSIFFSCRWQAVRSMSE